MPAHEGVPVATSLWFKAVRAWVIRARRNAIAIGTMTVAIGIAVGGSGIAWSLAQGFLGGIALGFSLGYGYLLAANRSVGARAAMVTRWIALSQQREWAGLSAGRPVPTTAQAIDEWLEVAPRNVTTASMAGAMFLGIGALDRARGVQLDLSTGDKVAQFYARRLELGIAVDAGGPIDVEPLRAAIADLPSNERWRALGNLALLEARAVASDGQDPLPALARYFPFVLPDRSPRRTRLRLAAAYAGLVVAIACGVVLLAIPFQLDATAGRQDDLADLATAAGVIASGAALVVAITALVLRTRRWFGSALILASLSVTLLWLADQLDQSRIGTPVDVFTNERVLHPFEWMSLPMATVVVLLAVIGLYLLRRTRT